MVDKGCSKSIAILWKAFRRIFCLTLASFILPFQPNTFTDGLVVVARYENIPERDSGIISLDLSNNIGWSDTSGSTDCVLGIIMIAAFLIKWGYQMISH